MTWTVRLAGSTPSLHTLTFALGWALCACGSDDSPEAADNGADTIESDFAEDGGTEGETSNPTAGSQTDGDGGTNGGGNIDTGYDTLGEGDLRGLLTFTLYPADALTGEDILGMAGAWRDVNEADWSAIDDLFGVYGLQTNYPQPPADADALEHNGLLTSFDWGSPGDWLLAGNAMKLQNGDAAAQACLLYLGGEPTIEIPPDSGTLIPNYPLYAATNSPLQPDGCSPDATVWTPDTDYDIVLYGGDRFDTNALDAQVHTPAAFEISGPDFSVYQAPLSLDQDLTITWDDNSTLDTRVVIRVSDTFGRLFTIHATDDGEYVIPTADLAMLDVGAGTITVAREHIEDVPFTDGMVKAVTRFERWGYFTFTKAS